MTHAEHYSQNSTPGAVTRLPTADRERLRRLVRRFQLRDDGTVRPVADVTFELRLWHSVHLTVQDVHWLLNQEESR